jgi:predicted phage gp36 major capsid-like protein
MAMKKTLSQLHTLLLDVILPHLKGIQASQAEQRVQTDLFNRNLEEFRAEMQLRFAKIRAEIAACRQEVEDTMVTLREADRGDDTESTIASKKRLIH